MTPNDPEPEFSDQALATLEIALGSRAALTTSKVPDVRRLVRYVAGVLEPEDAASTEIAIAEHLSCGEMLATVYRTVESLRKLTWQELQSMRTADELSAEIRREWIECASAGFVAEERQNLTLAGLLSLAATGLKGANTAFGIISHLFDPGLAPRMPAFSAAARLAANLPLVDGHELRELGVQFEAEITSEGDLALTIGFTQGEITGLRSVWIGFEANRQWLRLGTADIFEGTASVHLPGFGKLLSLSPGQLPSNIFALRLDDWPTVCADGALVVQAGDEPFAEIERDPLIEDGNVCVDIRLLPHVADLRRSNELEMWFGTGGHVWQLLGRWPIPQDAGNTMSLKCPSPKPGQVGLVFPGVLKLALRP